LQDKIGRRAAFHDGAGAIGHGAHLWETGAKTRRQFRRRNAPSAWQRKIALLPASATRSQNRQQQ
jgi:hypothetical protein